MMGRHGILLFILMGVVACATPATVHQERYLASQMADRIRVDSTVAEDPAIEALLYPYRSRLRVSMDMVIAELPYDIAKAKPEGPLGNLAADMLRSAAVGMTGAPVDIAILNNGGLRVPLYAGPVTVGRVYELMPFDNFLVILQLKGEQVLALADELAAFGGEPVSGMRFRIEAGKAVDLLVGNATVEPDRLYTIATHNYLADGGGDFPSLWKPEARTDFSLMVRDIFIRQFMMNPRPTPRLEGRIR